MNEAGNRTEQISPWSPFLNQALNTLLHLPLHGIAQLYGSGTEEVSVLKPRRGAWSRWQEKQYDLGSKRKRS